MPKLKLKNSKSAMKRFKISGTGKVMRRSAKTNHFNARQTSKTRRSKRGPSVLAAVNKKDIRNLMPYSK